MTTMMPEPKLFTKVETFKGVEMETIYRQGKVPVDPKMKIGMRADLE